MTRDTARVVWTIPPARQRAPSRPVTGPPLRGESVLSRVTGEERHETVPSRGGGVPSRPELSRLRRLRYGLGLRADPDSLSTFHPEVGGQQRIDVPVDVFRVFNRPVWAALEAPPSRVALELFGQNSNTPLPRRAPPPPAYRTFFGRGRSVTSNQSGKP